MDDIIIEKKEKPFKNKVFTSTFVYFISSVLFVILDLLSAFHCFNFMGAYASYIVNAFIQVGIMFLIPLTIYKFITRKKLKTLSENFHYKSISWKTVGYSILIGFCAYFIVVIISVFCSSFLSFFGYTNPFASGGESSNSVGMFFLGVLLSAILPAICEEFINRGLILNGLKGLGTKKAIIFSALLFALMHFNINQAVYAFIMGLLLASLTLMTGSIFPAMIVHFMNNFSSLFYDFLGSLGSAGNFMNNFINGFFTGNGFLVIIKCISVCLVAFAIIAFAMARIFLIEKKRKLRESVISENLNPDDLLAMQEKAQEQTRQLISNLKNKKNIWSMLLPNLETEKTLPIHKIFLYSTILLSGLMTLFTLIWGFL